MFRFLFVFAYFFILSVNTVKAEMPTYNTSDYFYQCIRLNDTEDCVKQDISRITNDIKKQYRAVLTNTNIVGWHENLSENTTIMRDLWESWSAFLTRLCSLSHVSAKYLEKLIEEKNSCKLYYTQHHYDHMDKILMLLSKKIPEDKEQFEYIHIDEHDEEYDKCIEEGKKAQCIKEELQRTTKSIKNLYKTMSEDEELRKWNNGPDLKNGNFRDLYDSWIAYRNRMCSLSTWAYKVAYGDKSMSNEYCLLFFNLEKIEALEGILISSHSALDEEIIPDESEGGEAEGKTIKPLKRRFDTEQDAGDSLTTEETNSIPALQKTESENKTQQKKNNIPAWAK